jgi:hypothetical protein
MPIVSEAQRKAMYAAKAGRSTLGIPKKVGAEFVKAGPASSKLPERVKGYRAGGSVDDCWSPQEGDIVGAYGQATFEHPSNKCPPQEGDIVGAFGKAKMAKGGVVQDPRASRRNYAKGGPIF